MSATGCIRWAMVGLIVSLGVATANDSGPGPAPGETSREYNVLVLRMGTVDQGTMTFSASTSGTPTDGTTPGGMTSTSTGAENDQTGVTANPTATGNASPILPASFGSGNVSGNTSGSTTTNSPGTPTGTTTTANTGTTTGTLPTSYWTTAAANGRATASTTDSSSPAYWTRARANGQAQSGASGGFGSGGGIASSVSTGKFVANFTNSQTSGSWYAIDLGSFALWFATGDSTEGTVTFAGYATPATIIGRTSVGTGGFFEALFTGSFFVGQAIAVDDDGMDDGTNDDGSGDLIP